MALAVTEQLALGQRLGERRTVHRDERSRPPTPAMKRARDNLLAGSRLPLKYDRQIAGRRLPQGPERQSQRGAAPEARRDLLELPGARRHHADPATEADDVTETDP